MKLPLPTLRKNSYIPVYIIGLLLCLIIYFVAYRSLTIVVEDSLEEMAIQGARLVHSEVQKRMDLVRVMANDSMSENPDAPVAERLANLSNQFDLSVFENVVTADTSGNAASMDGSSLSILDRRYFKEALSGKESIEFPIISRISKNTIIVFAVPLSKDGKIVGVLAAGWPAEELSLITDEIKVTKNGYAYISNKDGLLVTHKDKSLIASQALLDKTMSDPAMASTKKMNIEMRSGKIGVSEYTFNGVTKYMGYAPIEGTTWFIAVTAPKSEVFSDINRVLVLILIGVVFFVIFLTLLNLYTGRLQKKLSIQEKLSKKAIETGGIVTLKLDQTGRILDFNSHFSDKTGLTEAIVKAGTTLQDIVTEAYKERSSSMIKEILSGTHKGSFELAFAGNENKKIFVIWNLVEVEAARNTTIIDMMGLDISEIMAGKDELQSKNKELSYLYDELNALYEELSASEEELKDQYDNLLQKDEKVRRNEERYVLVAETTNTGIWEHDFINEENSYYSPRWGELFNLPTDKFNIPHNDILSRVHPEDVERFEHEYTEYLDRIRSSYNNEYRLCKEDGSYIWVSSVARAIWDESGELLRIIGAVSDITAKKQYEEKIKRLAFYDVLTNLPNRTFLIEKFNELADGGNEPIALIFMDIDNFKLINDSYGHNTGDIILVETATRLLSVVKDNSMVFRLGGDEFAILSWGDINDTDIEEYIKAFVHRLEKAYLIHDNLFNITVSIGLSVYPKDALSFSDLLKNSDTAMYKAKETGKNHFMFFDDKMKTEILKKMQISSQLPIALENEEFRLFYQPQYRTSDEQVLGFEALLRWKSPVLGNISPVDFISIAEETRIIIPLGTWVLREACRFLKEINSIGEGRYFMSVNISVLQIIRNDFCDLVFDILDEFGLSPDLLELEITESVFIESFDIIVENILKLKNGRVKIALDDFGKGYSSLNYLKRLPISAVKIDKSFIDSIMSAEEKDVLVDAIIMIGRNMGLTVVAEGVETSGQFDYLVKYLCDRIQGYYFSKPLPEEEARKLIG
ncbi:MAG: EAL domain-containing protein [Clostridiales bacterium]|nr:EAL domain-containing protein [Clostridiales bacterium]